MAREKSKTTGERMQSQKRIHEDEHRATHQLYVRAHLGDLLDLDHDQLVDLGELVLIETHGGQTVAEVCLVSTKPTMDVELTAMMTLACPLLCLGAVCHLEARRLPKAAVGYVTSPCPLPLHPPTTPSPTMFSEIYSLFLDKWSNHGAQEEPLVSSENVGAEKKHTNNWAVLVCSSRYWFNYRVCCVVDGL